MSTSLMLDMTQGKAHTPPAPSPIASHPMDGSCHCEAHTVGRREAFLTYYRTGDPAKAERKYRQVLAAYRFARGER